MLSVNRRINLFQGCQFVKRQFSPVPQSQNYYRFEKLLQGTNTEESDYADLDVLGQSIHSYRKQKSGEQLPSPGGTNDRQEYSPFSQLHKEQKIKKYVVEKLDVPPYEGNPYRGYRKKLQRNRKSPDEITFSEWQRMITAKINRSQTIEEIISYMYEKMQYVNSIHLAAFVNRMVYFSQSIIAKDRWIIERGVKQFFGMFQQQIGQLEGDQLAQVVQGLGKVVAWQGLGVEVEQESGARVGLEDWQAKLLVEQIIEKGTDLSAQNASMVAHGLCMLQIKNMDALERVSQSICNRIEQDLNTETYNMSLNQNQDKKERQSFVSDSSSKSKAASKLNSISNQDLNQNKSYGLDELDKTGSSLQSVQSKSDKNHKINQKSQIKQTLKSNAQTLSREHVTITLWAFGKLGYYDPIFFKLSAEYVKKNLKNIIPTDVGLFAWVHSKVRHRNPGLFEILCNDYVIPKINEFSDVNIVRFLWGCAKTGFYHQEFLQKFVSLFVENKWQLHPTYLLRVINALADLEYYEKSNHFSHASFFNKENSFKQKVTSSSLTQQENTLDTTDLLFNQNGTQHEHNIVKFELDHGYTDERNLFNYIVKKVSENLQYMRSSQLISILSAFSRLQIYDSQLVCDICAKCISEVQAYNLLQLSIICKCLVNMNHYDYELFAKIVQNANAKVSEFQLGQLVDIMWCLTKAEHVKNIQSTHDVQSLRIFMINILEYLQVYEHNIPIEDMHDLLVSYKSIDKQLYDEICRIICMHLKPALNSDFAPRQCVLLLRVVQEVCTIIEDRERVLELLYQIILHQLNNMQKVDILELLEGLHGFHQFHRGNFSENMQLCVAQRIEKDQDCYNDDEVEYIKQCYKEFDWNFQYLESLLNGREQKVYQQNM
eukprot:TRINITY_DN16317_c0_g1_i1.p1 TRINITY_DN16317_c0_g1~~TRINITY_DN16317_c0_g1_i1.p1  ORF type:complete len:883 (-),score=53.59 TRINITY_DN16317_c0_g1_i1:277-2925(-)